MAHDRSPDRRASADSTPASPLARSPARLARRAVCASILLIAIGVADGTTQEGIPGEQRLRELVGLDVLVSLPVGYEARGEPSPLLLFLHGGDRSNTRHHPARYAADEGIDFPFIVAAPHCTGGCAWPRVDFDTLLETLVEDLNVDRSRIYLTGYSMGGIGAWDLLGRSPDWFAAAAPIAGGGDPATVCVAREVAVQAVHGDRDNVIPLQRSRQMVDALQACGGSAGLLVLAGVGHGSWIPTFKDPSFWSWMLEQRRESSLP